MKKTTLPQHISKYFLTPAFFACGNYAYADAQADIINIHTPDNGISLNRTESFQVGTDSTVFNNSISATTTSIAGNISANPNLHDTPASLIIQEMTGILPARTDCQATERNRNKFIYPINIGVEDFSKTGGK